MRRYLSALLLSLGCATTVDAASVLIQPDGTGDYPTIQAAFDAVAPGDTVLLGAGVYAGPGNRDLDFAGKALLLRSVSGNPADVTIDCGGTDADPHRGFWFHSGEDSSSCVAGVTITGGYGHGSAILCEENPPGGLGSSPLIESCIIFANEGAALVTGNYMYDPVDPIFRKCTFRANGTGALIGVDSSASFTDCSFEANSNYGIHLIFFARPRFLRCHFLDNVDHAVHSNPETYGSFRDCLFSDNGNEASLGGAVYLPSFVKAARSGVDKSYQTFENCRFIDNVAQQGGAVWLGLLVQPTFAGCSFERNHAVDGGVFYCQGDAGPVITRSIMMHNSATRGGVLFCEDYFDPVPEWFVPHFLECTLYANRADEGSAFYARNMTGAPRIRNCIVAWGKGGEAVTASLTGPWEIVCTDIIGNEGGDWTGPIADLVNANGNFSADPCFCDADAGVFTLSADSWCLAGHHPWGCDSLVGALDEGCAEVGCAGVVPVFAADFTARVSGQGIDITWRLMGPAEEARLRLLGMAFGEEWEVFFSIGPDGSCSAIDRQGLTALARSPDAIVAYELQMADARGWTPLMREVVAAGQRPDPAPSGLRAVPNPFNPSTSLSFGLERPARTRLTVHDLRGRLLRILVDADLQRGGHRAEWDGRDSTGRAVGAGSYLARLEVEGRIETLRMGLVR